MEGVATGDQVLAQFLEVINFAVENQDATAIRGIHGLGRRRTEVEDGQADMTERNTSVGVFENALPVRAAMGLCSVHSMH